MSTSNRYGRNGQGGSRSTEQTFYNTNRNQGRTTNRKTSEENERRRDKRGGNHDNTRRYNRNDQNGQGFYPYDEGFNDGYEIWVEYQEENRQNVRNQNGHQNRRFNDGYRGQEEGRREWNKWKFDRNKVTFGEYLRDVREFDEEYCDRMERQRHNHYVRRYSGDQQYRRDFDDGYRREQEGGQGYRQNQRNSHGNQQYMSNFNEFPYNGGNFDQEYSGRQETNRGHGQQRRKNPNEVQQYQLRHNEGRRDSNNYSKTEKRGNNRQKGSPNQKPIQQPKTEQKSQREKNTQEKMPTNGEREEKSAELKTPKKARGKIEFVVPELVDIHYEKDEDEWKRLDNMILDVYNANRLTEKKVRGIQALVDELQDVIREKIPDARLDLFGSAVNGCGSSKCDVDICFRFEQDQPPPEVEPFEVIRKLRSILKKSYGIRSCWFKAIDCRVPIVKMKIFGTDADISYYNDTALKNTALLKKYCEWEPNRFPQLVLWIKTWAKALTINDSKAGTLSSYALTLMLIHFLQQCEPPVLPSWTMDLEEIPDDYDFANVEVIPNWSRNEKSLGQLFVEFLDYYSRFDFNKLISILRKELVNKDEKKFEEDKKYMVAIEDPYLPEFNPGYIIRDFKFNKILCSFRLSRQVFMEKIVDTTFTKSLWEQCTAKPEEVKNDNNNAKQDLEKEKEAMAHRVFKAMLACRGDGNISQLIDYYNRLTNYPGDFMEDVETYFGKIPEVFKHPFLAKRVHFTPNEEFQLKEEKYTMDALNTLSGFYANSNNKNEMEGARRFISVLKQGRGEMTENTFMRNYQRTFGVPFVEEYETYFDVEYLDDLVDIMENYGVEVRTSKNGKFIFSLPEIFKSKKSFYIANELIRKLRKLDREEAAANEGSKKEHESLEDNTLSSHPPPSQESADLKTETGFDSVMTSKTLELEEITHTKTEEEWKSLDELLYRIYWEYRMTKDRVEQLEEWTQDILRVIRKHIPDARLDIHGSTANGCGTAESDVDLCFRFSSNEPPEGVEPSKLVIRLREILSEEFNESDAKFVIAFGRVPLLKIVHRGFKGDISYYNTLTLKRSALLRKYCEWEPDRFPQLAIWLKKWAKDCTINDAASGTFSSYVLILMLIHYLQQCSPPVLPPWELSEEEDMVNCPVQPNWSQNIQSVGKLFVGFLDYYCHFDYNMRISIKKIEYKHILDPKNNAEYCIAMEDPYDRAVDPGKTITKSGLKTIRSVFRSSRKVFMDKMERAEWNEEIRRKCCPFLEARKRVETSIEQQNKGALRILNALLHVGETGTIEQLVFAYFSLYRPATLKKDCYIYFGTKNNKEVFQHPYLATCITFVSSFEFRFTEEVVDLLTKEGYRTKTKELQIIMNNLVDYLQLGNNNDKFSSKKD